MSLAERGKIAGEASLVAVVGRRRVQRVAAGISNCNESFEVICNR
jgi:hypothetical protein